PTALLDVNGTASVSGSLTFRNGAGSIQTTAFSPLTIGGNTTGQVTINGGNGSGNGITFQGYSTGIIHSDVNGVLTSSKVNLTNGVDVTGLLPVINGGSPFTEGNGSIFQRNTTEDLLLGSNATSSAK